MNAVAERREFPIDNSSLIVSKLLRDLESEEPTRTKSGIGFEKK